MAAIDRSLIEQVPQAGEQRRFLKPLIAKLSRNWHEIGIEAERREGESAYSMLALIGLSLDFIVSFMRRPFPRLAGFGLAVLGVSILIVAGYVPLRLMQVIEGQPRLQVLVAFSALFGFLAVSLGMLGEYIHRIYRLMQGEAFFEVRKEHKR